MKMKTIAGILLASLLCINCGVADEKTDTLLIVRFEDGLSKEQARKKIESVGASFVEVISAERHTYLAKCKLPAERDQAIKRLQKDKQVRYAESETTYKADQKHRQLKTVRQPAAVVPKAVDDPAAGISGSP